MPHLKIMNVHLLLYHRGK